MIKCLRKIERIPEVCYITLQNRTEFSVECCIDKKVAGYARTIENRKETRR